MSKKEPLVSVLLCVYNGEKYLDRAIESILKQTYKNWELIIIDDGSTDSTSHLLAKYKNPKIRVYRHENQGLTKSLNVAAKFAKGSILARQDADDISMPKRFELQVKIFKESADVVMASSNVDYIDENGEFLFLHSAARNKLEALKKISSLVNPFVHGTLMFSRETFDALGGYNEEFKTSQDFDLIARMSSKGQFASVPIPLYQQCLHENSITSKRWKMQIVNTIRTWKELRKNGRCIISPAVLMKFILKSTTIALIFAPISALAMHYYRMGGIYSSKNDFDNALRYYRKALNNSFFFVPAWIKYILCQFKSRI